MDRIRVRGKRVKNILNIFCHPICNGKSHENVGSCGANLKVLINNRKKFATLSAISCTFLKCVTVYMTQLTQFDKRLTWRYVP